MPRKNTSQRKILDAAADEFSACGYHSTSMDAIATRAAVAKGTLYYNFPTKAALFVAVIEDGMGYLMGEVKRTVESDAASVSQIRTIIRLHVSLFVEHPQIVRIMFNELSAGLDAEIRSDVVRLRTRYTEFLSDVIRLGISDGVILQADPAALAHLLVDLLFSAANYVVDHRETTNVDAMVALVDAVVLTGLLRGSAS